MNNPPCPICWHEETMHARRNERHRDEPRPEEMLEWRRPFGGARGQVLTRWDNGSWLCPACGAPFIPRDAAVLLDAVLTVSQGTSWRDDPIMFCWFEDAAKGGPT